MNMTHDKKGIVTITNSWGVAPGYDEYRLWRKNTKNSCSMKLYFIGMPGSLTPLVVRI
jgi:hypothetical protein